jgi:hypothetical protein
MYRPFEDHRNHPAAVTFPRRVVHDKIVVKTPRLYWSVMAAIATLAQSQRAPYASVETLARMARCSAKSVKRHCRTAVKLGMIDVTFRRDGSTNLTNAITPRKAVFWHAFRKRSGGQLSPHTGELDVKRSSQSSFSSPQVATTAADSTDKIHEAIPAKSECTPRSIGVDVRNEPEPDKQDVGTLWRGIKRLCETELEATNAVWLLKALIKKQWQVADFVIWIGKNHSLFKFKNQRGGLEFLLRKYSEKPGGPLSNRIEQREVRQPAPYALPPPDTAPPPPPAPKRRDRSDPPARSAAPTRAGDILRQQQQQQQPQGDSTGAYVTRDEAAEIAEQYGIPGDAFTDWLWRLSGGTIRGNPDWPDPPKRWPAPREVVMRWIKRFKER